MSVRTHKRQLLDNNEDMDDAILHALLYPNHVLSNAELLDVQKNVTWETTANTLSTDYASALQTQASEKGTDYTKNTLLDLGNAQDTEDPCPLYSAYGGPDGLERHLYGQGVSIEQRPWPVRSWNAPAVTALGSGLPEPGQSGPILPPIIQDQALQRFLAKVSSSTQINSTTPPGAPPAAPPVAVAPAAAAAAPVAAAPVVAAAAAPAVPRGPNLVDPVSNYVESNTQMIAKSNADRDKAALWRLANTSRPPTSHKTASLGNSALSKYARRKPGRRVHPYR